jgi:hypothetical protein
VAEPSAVVVLQSSGALSPRSPVVAKSQRARVSVHKARILGYDFGSRGIKTTTLKLT